MRTHTLTGQRPHAILALTAVIALVAGLGIRPANGATETPLTAFFNNTGTQADPSAQHANFDGGGNNYAAVALRVGDPANGYPGVVPGQAITKNGFTFTWPNRPAGSSDNVSASGQTIPVTSAPGATKIGFLTSASNGPASGSFVFNYTATDAEGNVATKSVTTSATVTDWTRGLTGDAALAPNNTLVLKTLFRTSNVGALPLPTQPNVFLLTLPLDPAMTLTSVKLPQGGSIHVFALATA